ncbi:class I SAM-dependent methyltransferase [Pseudonocardiaceae bacterium YIM PH 21723]|nr:class I SAM-dependent methyltransferase [Pseudonocardiaceae bacterium YIM PH 21723]
MNAYDLHAHAYARHNETSAWNALYERPEILKLAGEVAGLRVLDAGCGSGLHAAELIDRGAVVTGIDRSAGLLEIARERLGATAVLRHADLAEPLPFPSDGFELVLSSLVLHYLEDWEPTLREFHRVLVPGGRLVLSTHHPFLDEQVSGNDRYLSRYEFDDEWTVDGRPMRMRYWHRPLRDMTSAFAAAGFAIQTIEEPGPDPAIASVDPRAYGLLSRRAQFLFFELSATTGRTG